MREIPPQTKRDKINNAYLKAWHIFRLAVNHDAFIRILF